MSTLSKNLRLYRYKMRLSQADLAAQIEVTQNTVSNWENGTRAPSVERLVLIAEILGVTPNILTGVGSDPKKESVRIERCMFGGGERSVIKEEILQDTLRKLEKSIAKAMSRGYRVELLLMEDGKIVAQTIQRKKLPTA